MFPNMCRVTLFAFVLKTLIYVTILTLLAESFSTFYMNHQFYKTLKWTMTKYDIRFFGFWNMK